MGAYFLLVIPVLSLAIDYTSWIEACWVKGLFLTDYERWPEPISSYLRLEGLFIRNGLLIGALSFAWVVSRSTGSDAIAAGLASGILFVAHVGYAIWSFRNNLQGYWSEEHQRQ